MTFPKTTAGRTFTRFLTTVALCLVTGNALADGPGHVLLPSVPDLQPTPRHNPEPVVTHREQRLAHPHTLRGVVDAWGQTQGLQAEFVQHHITGNIMRGTLYILKPGQIRLEYHDARRSTVLVHDGQVVVFDHPEDGQPTVYPVQHSPLHHLLRNVHALEETGEIQMLAAPPGRHVVILHDRQHPESGRLVMEFEPHTLQLNRWHARTAYGETVTMVLHNVQPVTHLSPYLFDPLVEIENRNPRLEGLFWGGYGSVVHPPSPERQSRGGQWYGVD